MSNTAVDIFSAFATNKDQERKGKLTLIPGCGDTKFLLARVGQANTAYVQLMQKLYKRNKQVIDSGGQAAKDKNDEVMAEVFARTILLGWEGTISFKGKQVPYSYETAKEMLLLSDFREAVAAVAEGRELFLAEEQAESEGN